MGISKHGVGYRADFTKNGVRHKSPVFDTRIEAEDWETIRRGQIASGEWQPEGATSQALLTVKEVLEWYGKVHTPSRVTEPHREISRINTICRNSISNTLISELDNSRLLKYIRDRRSTVRIVKGVEKCISRKTIENELNVMHKAIAAALFEKEIEVNGVIHKLGINGNPVETKELLRHSAIPNDSEKREALSKAVQKTLIAAAKNYSTEVYNFIRLAIATGQRRGELLEQDWSKIYITDKYLISKNKAPKRQPEDKTREVPLSPTAREVLRDIGVEESGLLFPILAGEVDRINDAIETICAENQLPHITPHQFRHTCETNNQLNGVEREKRDMLLGHKTQGMAGVYSHANPRDFADEYV